MSEVKLILGDALDVLREMEPGSVDAVVTDPPYGCGFVQGYSNRLRPTRFHDRPIIGDDKPFDPTPFLGFPVVIIFGANNFSDKLPSSRGWIFWLKRPDMLPNDFGDGELIWTNQDRSIRCFKYLWNGVLQAGEKGSPKYHPAQKPIALMRWLIENYTQPGDTVLDPFMGSGSTGVAAVQTGRNFIGVEIDPTYYAIAEKRIAQAQAQPPLIPHEAHAQPVQNGLLEAMP